MKVKSTTICKFERDHETRITVVAAQKDLNRTWKANMNANIFGEDSDLDDLDANDSALPFPKPLDRSAFLKPSFNAAKFLSSLNNRFQTLEDLQVELQDLLKGLNKELVDLVNDNYTDFLSLGDRLRGGEERIEEIRVGLLGFQRDVTGVRDLVTQRSNEIKELLQAKTALRKDIQVGRRLLEIDERLEELEHRNKINIAETSRPVDVTEREAANDDDDDEDAVSGGYKDWDGNWLKIEDLDLDAYDSEDDATEDKSSDDITRGLTESLDAYEALQALCRQCGSTHPFVLAQRDRVTTVREVLRKQIEGEIRRQTVVQTKQRLIQIRAKLDEE